MATSFVNPLAQVAGFKNQQLADVTRRQGGSVRPATANNSSTTATAAPQLDTGLSSITDRATRQHNTFLTALKAEQNRRQPSISSTTESSPSYSKKTFTGSNRPGYGKYGLTQAANNAFVAMNNAFRQKFGYDMKVNRGYRSYEQQARLYALYKAGKGNLAAAPGKSVHQSGRAIDFGGALHNSGSREHAWLRANAAAFGYKWTGKNFGQKEDWHWEYRG